MPVCANCGQENTGEAAEVYREAMELWKRKGNLVRVNRCRQALEELGLPV